MALTFTCTLSVTEGGRGEVQKMMLSALGCNVAWGLVDGFMFVFANFVERARALRTLRALRATSDSREADRILLDALPPVAATVLRPDQVGDIRRQIASLSEIPTRPALGKDDWLGAVGVFFLVFLSTFPVVIPFIFIHESATAMRVSNLIAVILLFFGGYSLGRYAAHRPWLMGLMMALVGSALVGITIALGG
ncbi:MAG: hypothetical protein K8R87_11440 [Verrucomicrobia bacterium]|nr:hypothetical protein [Verrucomicrobiota bacterium]